MDCDISFLRECFEYNADSGMVRWKSRPLSHFRDARSWKIANTMTAGCLVGSYSQGYLKVRLLGVNCGVHRIAWALAYGAWPAKSIDHINGVRDDNRLENLRLATASENAHNSRRQVNNKLGLKGVSKATCGGKFRAQIAVNGVVRHLGVFSTPEEAHVAYIAAARDLHGEFARSG